MPYRTLEFKNPTLRAAPHQRVLEILNHHWEPAVPGAHTGAGVGNPMPKMRAGQFIRAMDGASPKIIHAIDVGERFEEVIFSLFETDSAAEKKPFYTVSMKLAHIESHQVAGPEKGKAIEHFVIVFDNYKIEYR